MKQTNIRFTDANRAWLDKQGSTQDVLNSLVQKHRESFGDTEDEDVIELSRVKAEHMAVDRQMKELHNRKIFLDFRMEALEKAIIFKQRKASDLRAQQILSAKPVRP